MAAHAPRDRRTNNFEAVVLERLDGSGDFVAISQKPCSLFILILVALLPVCHTGR